MCCFVHIKVDNNKTEMNPNDLAKGVPFWKSNMRMNELCEFLAYYARQVHSKRYYRTVLVNNPGATFLDVITASDVAYAISLIKNGRLVWIEQLHKAKSNHNGDEMHAINEMVVADEEGQEEEEEEEEKEEQQLSLR